MYQTLSRGPVLCQTSSAVLVLLALMVASQQPSVVPLCSVFFKMRSYFFHIANIIYNTKICWSIYPPPLLLYAVLHKSSIHGPKMSKTEPVVHQNVCLYLYQKIYSMNIWSLSFSCFFLHLNPPFHAQSWWLRWFKVQRQLLSEVVSLSAVWWRLTWTFCQVQDALCRFLLHILDVSLPHTWFNDPLAIHLNQA